MLHKSERLKYICLDLLLKNILHKSARQQNALNSVLFINDACICQRAVYYFSNFIDVLLEGCLAVLPGRGTVIHLVRDQCINVCPCNECFSPRSDHEFNLRCSSVCRSSGYSDRGSSYRDSYDSYGTYPFSNPRMSMSSVCVSADESNRVF